MAAADGTARSMAGHQSTRRIAPLDALRGVAVLGMLVVHIQLFAYPSLARWNPTAYGDLGGANRWVWLLTALLADGKFITIFAMLLGASVLMLAGDAGRRGLGAGRLHARRMTVLLVLGLVHAYGLWYGDMLVPLALSGTVVFFARRLAVPALLVLGGLAVATGSALSFALTWSARADAVALAAWSAQWTPRPEVIALEIARYRGGWAAQMAHRVPAALETQTWDVVSRLLWQMAGQMLIGMALFKTGVLTAARSPAFYACMATAAAGAGVVLVALGLWRSIATGWDLLDYALVSQQFHYWGNLFVALGWTALVMLLGRLGWRLGAVAAVGRMALTNYLLQTLICTTIFYGHGFGLFGRVDRAGQVLIVLGVWAVQLIASSAWLRYFAVGPAEWVTRWLVHGRRPGLLRSSPAVAEV